MVVVYNTTNKMSNMNWVIYSLIMYLASVFQYLLVRGIQKRGIDNRIINFLFLLPAAPFVYAYAQIAGVSLGVLPIQLILIISATFLFSYLGNKTSFIGIQNAPNPGYSLVIQKSYAVYTAIAAVFLFGAKLSIQSILAILIIVLFSGTILLDSKTTKKTKTLAWVASSFIAFICFGNLALFSKYMQLQNVNPITLSFYFFIFNGVFGGIELFYSRNKVIFKHSTSTWVILLVIGLSNGLFNLAMQLAYKTAPNIGFVNIINASSITAITLLSAYFYKDKLTIEKVIGVVGVALGLILLIII